MLLVCARCDIPCTGGPVDAVEIDWGSDLFADIPQADSLSGSVVTPHEARPTLGAWLARQGSFGSSSFYCMAPRRLHGCGMRSFLA